MRYSIIAAAAAVTAVHAQTTTTAQIAIDCASPIAGTIVQPSGQPQITACANSLNLGDTCGASEQCRNGADCWGSNSGIIRRCGNFNAACERDDQCAYNTCNNGLCNGFIASSSSSGSVTATSSSYSATASCAPPGGYDSQGRYSCNPAHQYPAGQTCVFIDGCPLLQSATGSSSTQSTTSAPHFPPTYTGGNNSTSLTRAPTGSGAPKPTSSVVQYTGGAPIAGTLSGLGALIAGIAAFVL